MTTIRNFMVGVSLTAGVAATVLVGLPKLADATAVNRDEIHWQARAAEFESASETALPSKIVRELADLHLDDTLYNPWMRDNRANGLETGGALHMIAKSKAANQEIKCLAEAVYYEARSETLAGQKAVAEVVLNRVKSKHFPSSICAVVYQGAERTTGCQFSFACDGSNAILPKGKMWKRSQDVAAHMYMGASSELTRRATHYHTTDINPHWAPHLRETRTYGAHKFYRFMPRRLQLRTVSAAP